MKTSVIEVRDMLSVLSTPGVEKRIGEVPGVESVTVNYDAGSATVRYDETRLNIVDIRSYVRQSGYEPAALDAASAGDEHEGHTAPGAPPATPAPAAPKPSPAAAPPSAAPEPAPNAAAAAPASAAVSPGDGHEGHTARGAPPATPAPAAPKLAPNAAAAAPAPGAAADNGQEDEATPEKGQDDTAPTKVSS